MLMQQYAKVLDVKRLVFGNFDIISEKAFLSNN